MSPHRLGNAAQQEIANQLRATIGLGIDLFAAPGGEVVISALPHHLVSMHVGAPVRVACRAAGREQRRLQMQGDIDLLPAGHGGVWVDEAACTALVLRLEPRFLNDTAEGMGLDPARIALAPRLQLRDPLLEQLGWALKAELETGFPAGRLYAESLGTTFAAHLLCRYARPAPRLPRQGLSRLQRRRVLEHIEAHLGADLSLARLAKIAGLSPSHFKPLFRQSMGLPVHQYVIRRRVEQAKKLLLRRRLGIAEAAAEAGFAHQSHLARCMRRVLGVSPRELLRYRD